MLAVHDLSIAAAPDMADVRAALVAYVEALVEDEWPKMSEAPRRRARPRRWAG